jgi:hypothetical protein
LSFVQTIFSQRGLRILALKKAGLWRKTPPALISCADSELQPAAVVFAGACSTFM